MKTMKLKSRLTVWCMTLAMLSFGFSAFAQQSAPTAGSSDEISEASIKKFVEINKTLAPAQMEAQQKMVTIIQGSGLDMQQFSQMAMAMQQGDETYGDATADDKKAFEAAMEKIAPLQQEVEQKMMKAVEEAGMEMEEFQQIAMAYQQDAELQQKINGMMQE